jgi:hypothetical protein
MARLRRFFGGLNMVNMVSLSVVIGGVGGARGCCRTEGKVQQYDMDCRRTEPINKVVPLNVGRNVVSN